MSTATRLLRLLLLPLMLIGGMQSAQAAPDENATPEDRQLGWVSLELDAVTTPLGARNLLLLVEPPDTHWSIGGGANGGDYVGIIDDLLFDGFDVQLRPSPVSYTHLTLPTKCWV